MKKILLALLPLLTACSDSSPPPPPPPPPLLTSVALPVVDFPVYAPKDASGTPLPTTLCLTDPTCAKIGYVTQAVYGKIAGTIAFAYEITEVGNPAYQYKLNPDNVCEAPASFRLFFQSLAGDRWWASPPTELIAGAGAASAPLTGDRWSNATGQFGTALPAQFEAAKAGVGQIGITFGGGCFAGHGVNISQGSSRFTSTSYVVAP